ncbi:MAG TPA: hypothetical protein VFL72_02465 [Acidimicrobiia bacterium]|nr:hypothetical protein [Acidimicrobiia bacterium]
MTGLRPWVVVVIAVGGALYWLFVSALIVYFVLSLWALAEASQ